MESINSDFKLIDNRAEVIGKKYNFTSARGTTFKIIGSGKVRNEVTFSDDRLLIDTFPKSASTVPVALYEDIIGINVSVKLNAYYIILIILSLVSTPFVPPMIILAIFLFWIGRDRKITITQRGGMSIVIYSRTKNKAEEFVNDIKKVANIR